MASAAIAKLYKMSSSCVWNSLKRVVRQLVRAMWTRPTAADLHRLVKHKEGTMCYTVTLKPRISFGLMLNCSSAWLPSPPAFGPHCFIIITLFLLVSFAHTDKSPIWLFAWSFYSIFDHVHISSEVASPLTQLVILIKEKPRRVNEEWGRTVCVSQLKHKHWTCNNSDTFLQCCVTPTLPTIINKKINNM